MHFSTKKETIFTNDRAERNISLYNYLSLTEIFRENFNSKADKKNYSFFSYTLSL